MAIEKVEMKMNCLDVGLMFTDDTFYPIEIKLKPIHQLVQTDGYTPMFDSMANKTIERDFINGFCFDPILGWFIMKNGLYITTDMIYSVTMTVRSDEDD